MNTSSRIPAALAYVPLLGWLYVLFLARKNLLAIYHLKQSVGLFLFLIAATAAWAAVAWLTAWIPFMFILGIALFGIAIGAYLYGLVAWVLGLINALNARLAPLPLFGEWASRLPIQ